MSMMWVGIGSAVLSVGGGLVSSNAASKAQQGANATNAKIAADANAQNWNQYLLSRGINPGGLPGVNSGAVNTVLPLGFTLNGQSAEQGIFDRIMGVANEGEKYKDPSYAVSAENIASFLQANPQVRTDLTKMLAENNDGRSVEQWLHDDAIEGDPNFSSQLSNHAQGAQQSYQQSLELPPQYQKLLDYGPQTLDQLYGGQFLAQQKQAQAAINAQRLALAATAQQGIDEQRLKAGNTNAGQLSDLGDILNARTTGSKGIYDAELGVADAIQARINEQRTKFGNLNTGQLSDLDRILSTRTAGSQGIYDASLLQADTYSNAVKQATSDELQRQRAARALAGFVGTGSGDATMRARTLASGYQAAAGARAQAGVDQASRLYNIGDSDVTQRFDVNSKYLQALTGLLDSDATAARATAGVGQAGRLYDINEANATSKFNINSDYLKTLQGLLDANGAGAMAQAGLTNATDDASVLSNDISTRLANLNAPATLVGSRLNLDSANSANRYSDINSLLSALGFFKQGQPSTPGYVAPQVSPAITGGQTAGAAISSVGTGLAQYYQNQQLMDALKGMGGGTYKGIPVAASSPSSTW